MELPVPIRNNDVTNARPALRSPRLAPAGRPGSVGAVPPSRLAIRDARPVVRGKFLYAGKEKLWIRGVTYGAFQPDDRGNEYHDLKVIERDFSLMAAYGVNAVRIPHTTPPRSLLDLAHRYRLRVMVGLSAEQYVGYLIDQNGAPDIEALIRAKVRTCAGHPALLCYAIGNEIPAPVARWLGRRRVESYLERLYRIVKAEDPDGLVTYVNYPSTEYLQLPFLDFVSFNVYLEAQERLAAYLARLQNIAGDRPLVMSELGLDSLRHGTEAQARVLDWQVRTTFASGCAGAFIFAWTDEWYRAGLDVEDWAFGLTDKQRRGKPALAAVRQAFAEVPVANHSVWPRISVVVCTYNGARTIRKCLRAVCQLHYPDYEVIVVNDGSTDGTREIAEEFSVRVINTENCGLSSARNTGLKAATGEIVAYLDDDAYPDADWLRYLADSFRRSPHAAIGGPNVPPPVNGGGVADCVAKAPGGPIHVLVGDEEAEHIPGCNMAFRKTALEAIGGFDPQFRTAGDDVDICWRIRDRGWTIGFNPGAMVWHHRRASVRAYWCQQRGYGAAEALLERKWPQKYNSLGHPTWAGRIYGNGHALGGRRSRIYHGTWGTAPFQSLYGPSPTGLGAVFAMPEWNLVVLALTIASALGLLWKPLFLALPLLLVAIAGPVVGAAVRSAGAHWPGQPPSRIVALRRYGMTLLLHLIQPLARLTGRMRWGLTPWRRSGLRGVAGIRRWQSAVWTEEWKAPDARLADVEAALATRGFRVRRGGDFDAWDLEVRNGLFGASRLLMAVEDHGAGSQLVRARVWARYRLRGLILVALASGLLLGTVIDRAWGASVLFVAITVILALYQIGETSAVAIAMREVVERAVKDQP